MSWLDRLERKFGRHVIHHLTPLIIVTYVTGYILELMGKAMGTSPLSILCFSPTLIMRGQVWRLVTWVLMPPGGIDFWTILMLICIYQQGVMLEHVWGDFKFDFYIFNGLILTLIAGFIGFAVSPAEMELYAIYFSTYYIALSVFLGLALTFPDMEFRFMFLIPIRAKYLVVFYAAYLLYVLIAGRSVLTGALIIASAANMVLFFFLYRKGPGLTRQQKKMRRNFRNATRGQNRGEKINRTAFGGENNGWNQNQQNNGWNQNGENNGWNGNGQNNGWNQNQQNNGWNQNGQNNGWNQNGQNNGWNQNSQNNGWDQNGQNSGRGDGTAKNPRGNQQRMRGYDKRNAVHRCTICGRTELDDPNLEFRYCSKCNGAYEYCQDHLYNHEHIR